MLYSAFRMTASGARCEWSVNDKDRGTSSANVQ